MPGTVFHTQKHKMYGDERNLLPKKIYRITVHYSISVQQNYKTISMHVRLSKMCCIDYSTKENAIQTSIVIEIEPIRVGTG